MDKDTNKVFFNHMDMWLEYVRTEKGLQQKAFNPGHEHEDLGDCVSFPNFQIAVAGVPYGEFSSITEGYSILPQEMMMKSITNDDYKIVFTYVHEKLCLSAVVEMVLIPGTNVIRQFTAVTNHGNEPVVLTHISSMNMQGIATDGIVPWHDKSKMKVYYCMQTWEGEGQWRSSDLEELGLYPNSVHPCAAAIHFSSVGSWSTGRYLPMAIIEDMETNKVWYFQIETSANWHFEIGHRGSWDGEKGSLYIHADGADEKFGGWTKKLFPGESFTSVPAAVGCCSGNFTDAVRELTKYRRSFLKPRNAWQGECPVIFNDYMNCLWGDPTKEKLIPLIDAAYKAGAECFCIDAGWFTAKGAMWSTSLGDWEYSNSRFGEEGLKGILEYIKSKHMIPGLWFEMEVCGEDAKLAQKPDSWFVMRNGKRVGGRQRWFLNFTNAEVCNYFEGIIDKLVAMGLGYIKNDYNACLGNGDDTFGSSSADGLTYVLNGFYSFIDKLRSKYHGLIFENCASGGMRGDYCALSHFHVQSSSDQEIYYNYPSILGGGLAGILPEQLGIWAYPYPLLFLDMKHPEILYSEEYQKGMQDGEQTIFNIVNGLCGNLFLSGHLEVADELNMRLIQEGISLYKRERKHIHNSFPIWPIGFTRINDRKSWASIGLANEDNTRVLLAVWRLGSDDECQELPLFKWAGKNALVKQLYPSESFDVKAYYNTEKGSLAINLPRTFQARFFEIIEV